MQVIVVFWDGDMLPVHAHVAGQQRIREPVVSPLTLTLSLTLLLSALH